MNLINDDCLDGIIKLDDNSIDLIFCDLPYGCTTIKWDEKIDLKKLSKELWRVSKDETPIVFTASMKFGLEIIDAMGKKNFKYEMIWEKIRGFNPFLCNIRPLKVHEFIFVFYKKQPKIYKKNLHKYHKKEYPRKVDNPDSVDTIFGKQKLPKKYGRYVPRLPKTVMKFYKHTENRLNKTQKPVELVEWFIKYYTDETGVVLDPTFGSGTTAVACKKLNRKFVGFEKDEIQYKQALKRLSEM